MHCPRCAHENPPHAHFCLECGAGLQIACTQCNAVLPPSAKFCMNCGHPVDGAVAVHDTSRPSSIPPLAEQEPDAMLAEGERRQATVLFSDLAGYTALNERLDPEEVQELMGRLKAEAVRVVDSHGGMVNQFVGDEVLALFGVPAAREDDPVQAVRAAFALHALARRVSAQVESQVGQPLRFHSGITSGLVVVRKRDHRDGTFGITGDTVNTAARLVGQAGPDEVVLGPETQRLVADYFHCQPLQPVVLRGKAEAVRPFRVTGETRIANRFEAAQRRGLTRYAGREAELSALGSALQRARGGQRQLVTVMGEPGIGKSRLMFEFRHAIDPEVVTVLEGRCQAHGQSIPYLPFVDTLRRGLRLQNATEPQALHDQAVTAIRTISSELEAYLPHLLHLLSITSEAHALPTGLHGESLPRALIEALCAVLTLAARNRPMVLILEDWHWADDASDAALKYLVGLVPHYPLLVAVTYRPDYTRAWQAAEHYLPLVIKPLDVQETGAMIRSVLGAKSLPADLAERVHERSAGNALFNEEVARGLAENGAVVVKDGVAALTQSLESVHLPSTVQAVIRARVDRLAPDAREVLRLASVVGREFGRAVMERLVPARSGMADALDTLIGQDLVQPVRVVPEPAWIFKHVLVQEVVYDTLLLQQRRDLHGRVGAILEDLHSSRLEEHYEALAHHYSLSDRRDKAVEYLERAGDKAARYFSLREARSQFQRAVRLLDVSDADLPSQGRFADLAVKWAEVSAYSASPENVEALDRTLLHARSVHDRELETSTLYWIGRMHYGLGEMNRAMAVLRECGARLAGDPDSDLLARSRIVLSTVCMYRGEFEAAIDTCRKAIPALARNSDIEQVAYGEGLLGLYCGLEGRFDEAARALDRALALSHQTQNKTRLAMTNLYVAVTQAQAGDLDRAIQSASEAVRIGLQIEIPVGAGIALGVKGWALFLTGQQDAGIRTTQEGIRTVRATQASLAMSVMLGWLAEEHALAGNAGEARQAVEEFMKLHELGNWWGLIPTLRARGIVDASGAQPNWERHFEQAIRLSEERLTRPETAVTLFRHAEILSREGKRARARVALEAAEALFVELGMSWWRQQASALRASLG